MGSLAEAVSLVGYRTALQAYCNRVDFAFDSVAGDIIAQRKPARYAGDSLRPLLVLWACDANGGDLTDALPIAAAFDLFDRFMLLHDELVDDRAESVARWGLGQSLNAGDALYAVGFRCLANDVADPQRRLLAAQIVAEAVLAAVGARCNERKGEAELRAPRFTPGPSLRARRRNAAKRLPARGALWARHSSPAMRRRRDGRRCNRRNSSAHASRTRSTPNIWKPHGTLHDATAETGTSARKSEHIRINIERDVNARVGTGFDDYTFVHRALPEIDLSEVDTAVNFSGGGCGHRC